MSTSQDSTSAQTEEQIRELLGESLGFAVQEIQARGSFYPYATVLSTSGETQTLKLSPEEEAENPDSERVLGACRNYVIGEREGLTACAFTSDVSTPDGDAIRVELEHRDGAAILALLHYEQTLGARDSVSFGELAAHEGQPSIWT